MNSLATVKTKKIIEFGDFQTPQNLADEITTLVQKNGLNPQSIIEPTCGKGSFILSTLNIFPDAQTFIGVDINQNYLEQLLKKVEISKIQGNIKIIQKNFFELNWTEIINHLPEPILIIGNPPWITSSELGKLQSFNLPKKSNFQEKKGLDALTGKSNFDISEWMILQHLEWLKQRQGTIAMLCKMSVARKVLIYGWKNNYSIQQAWIYQIDAFKYFKASVDACLLILNFGQNEQSKKCYWFKNFSVNNHSHILGYDNDLIIADWENYNKYKHLLGIDKNFVWRSGIKHDCAKIMELQKTAQGYKNGYGINLSLEQTYIYPLLKSSDLGNERVSKCRKYILVTQKFIGENTNSICQNAPQTWDYLQANSEAFAKRKSSIYKNRPLFSIFGVGDYTFSPWKVAISGFYKKLKFLPIGLIEEKPIIFDDTIYFLSCHSEDEAKFIAELLNSEKAQLFYHSLIFWSDKRPITINLLKRLNLQALAKELKREKEYLMYSRGSASVPALAARSASVPALAARSASVPALDKFNVPPPHHRL